MTKPKAQTTTESSAQLPIDFEHAYAELENIVAQMESGQMPLETSLTAYQRGITVLPEITQRRSTTSTNFECRQSAIAI
jgi:exodeoxyribonuclease VII small subunit